MVQRETPEILNWSEMSGRALLFQEGARVVYVYLSRGGLTTGITEEFEFRLDTTNIVERKDAVVYVYDVNKGTKDHHTPATSLKKIQ